MKKKIIFIIASVLASCASFAQKNAIIYIGDGFGVAAKTATRMALGQGSNAKRYFDDPGFQVLQLDKLKFNGIVTTHSLNSWITDSAPGASVYASGQAGKVDNEVLGINPANGQPIETILENAKKAGYAVGLVTTTRVTHATPAAFASHVWLRDLENHIAVQYLTSNATISGVKDYEFVFNSSSVPGVQYDAIRDWKLPTTKEGVELDVILGGGARHFLPKSVLSANATVLNAAGVAITNTLTGAVVTFSGKRADNVDLIEFAKTQKNYKYVNSRDALINLDINMFTGTGLGSKKLLGLFNTDHVNYELDRQIGASWEPALAEMVDIAIKVLTKKGGSKGFFLIVEGGRIDHLAHANTGGITVTTGVGGNVYTVDSDKPAYLGGGDANYSASPTTARSAYYGSDYLINEVLAFDYAVGKGRSFLNTSSTGSTLMLSTSDHECGGVAIVGLHDEADDQNNGTKIRTYAQQIKSNNTFTGVDVTDKKIAVTPSGLTRGDNGDYGWFPDYIMTDVQGMLYPRPASATSRRIVVAYGSNPLTNGNGQKAGVTPGNHTPQDIWVGAEDNVGGSAAGKIAGRGLMDNTDLTPIMAEFLNLSYITTIPGASLNPSLVILTTTSALTLNTAGTTISGFTLVGTNITGLTTITAPSGALVSNKATTGFASSIVFYLSSGYNASNTIYFMNAGTISATGMATVSANGVSQLTFPINVVSPSVTASTPMVVSTTAGTIVSYNVIGYNLVDVLSITAPSPLIISSTSVGGYGSSLSVTPVSGFISTIVYVMSTNTTLGTGIISMTSLGLSPIGVPISITGSNTVPGLTPSITTSTPMNVSTTSGTIVSFNVSASNLSSSLMASVNDPLMISSSSVSGFGYMITIPATSGSIATMPLYIMSSVTTSGMMSSGIVTFTGTGLSPVFVPISITGSGISTGIGHFDDLFAKNTILYPNPVIDVTTIDFTIEEPSDISVEVFNNNGIFITKFGPAHYREGNNRIFIETSGLTSGNYYVIIKTAKHVILKKFVKL